jgi:3-oxoacyl-[acyl-carrier protein] reductase
MDRKLEGRVAVVTGAAQGIGASYARHLAELGATVVVADIDGDGAAGTAKEIRHDGWRASHHEVDVADSTSVTIMADAVAAEHGRADIVVNNAAIFKGIVQQTVEEMPVDYWRQVIDTNVTSVFMVSQAFLPMLKASPAGVIVNQGSIASFMAAPGMVHYTTSKAAVVAFTRGLATEVGKFGIRVNAIAPGFTETPAAWVNFPDPARHQASAADAALGRVGTPSDLCGALEFLVTEASAWMTGQTLVIDGGRCFLR